MPPRTLLVCHGTGVRSSAFAPMLELVKTKVHDFGLNCKVQPCLWGDSLGIDFEGLSLPELPARNPAQEEEEFRWQLLQVDPLTELRLWCMPGDRPSQAMIGQLSQGEQVWQQKIEPYQRNRLAQNELQILLAQNGVEAFFSGAWNAVVGTGLPETAFRDAGDETPVVARAFAEAVAAQMMHQAAEATPAAIVTPQLAAKIANKMLFDWGQVTLGVGDLLSKVFGRATRTVVRPMRSRASLGIAPAIGDILRYQSVGGQIRSLIRKDVETIDGDVFILAHSLGGIACVELMAEARANEVGLPQVKGIITAGSQSPLLYEFDALQTIRRSSPRLADPMPAAFPPWLNIYDENDLLSYRASRLFPRTKDLQVDCMLPPLQAHSAYWTLNKTWESIRAFMENQNA